MKEARTYLNRAAPGAGAPTSVEGGAVNLPRALVIALALAPALACSKAEQATGEARGAGGPVATCTKANEQCVYSPGKLGLCTASMECDASGQCLVCMSLH
jgi:hypothetical protein